MNTNPEQSPILAIDGLEDSTFSTGPNGQIKVTAKISSKDRLVMELRLIAQRTDLPADQKGAATAAYECFNYCLQSITFEFKDETRKNPPEISYETVDVKDLRHYQLYHDPTNLDFIAYRNQVEIAKNYLDSNEEIPGPLLAYIREAEIRFYDGEENIQKREACMHQLIKHHLEKPVVQYAILSILYTQQEARERLNEWEAEAIAREKPTRKPSKKQRTKNHLPNIGQGATYRKAGHMIDEILKSTKQAGPPVKLKRETQQDIEKAGVKLESVVEGIKLSSSEHKLIDSLYVLLHQKSQNSQPNKPDYYTGNGEAKEVDFGAFENGLSVLGKAPQIIVSLYELTKTYKGDDNIGGKDTENVLSIIQELSKRPYLVRHTETTYKKGGGRTERTIESFRPLIRLEQKYSEVDFDRNNIETSRKEDLFITMSPIFIGQIDTKYIEYPVDMIRRMTDAYGGFELPKSTLLLRDYLMRELSYKRLKPEIDEKNLNKQLCPEYVRKGDKARTIQYVGIAIDTLKKIGLLNQAKLTTGKNGQPKYQFELNENWS